MATTTDEELAGLSDEERAALADDEDSAEDVEILKSIANDDDDDEQDDAPVGDAQPDALTAAEPEPFTPKYDAPPVEGYAEQLAALAESKKALRQQYQDGDLELDAYEDARDAIESQVLSLRESNLKATLAAEQTIQTAQQRWQWEQDRFFVGAKEIYRSDRLLNEAFSAAVKSLAADPANEAKPMTWYLDEAERMTRASFGKAFGDSPKAEAQRKAERLKVPPNIGAMPGAELPDVTADEWSHLEKLDGMELERALSKLSPTDQDRYLRS